MEGRFKDWLEDALRRHDVSRRELARRLADQHPGDGDPESYRRNIGRILSGDVVSPSQPTREAIQAALDDFTAPSVDDEESDSAITREMLLDRIRRGRRELLQLERWVAESRLS